MRLILALFFAITLGTTTRQDTTLSAENIEIITRTDAFGLAETIVRGRLVNRDAAAYTNINIFADVYDASGEIIGEGFGFPVNACGTGLLDFTLQPQDAQGFSVALELFEDGTEVDRVELFPEGQQIEAARADSSLIPGVRGITNQEVVQVEWTDANTLRYGVGCDADIFSQYEWFEYSTATRLARAIEHPAVERITDALLTQLDLTDPADLNRSFLTFPVNSRRIVYQTDINTVLTAEPDGSFKRLIWDDLSRRSLHGFIWLPEGRFLAYYYGAFGEEVSFFTASLEGQRISGSIYNTLPSRIIPGPSPDGVKIVIANTVDEVSGYFLADAVYNSTELLFETDNIPENNWPAPIYHRTEAEGDFIYIARPVEDVPMLQCFNMQTRELQDLTRLPLQLTSDDRAWTTLSPDGTMMALSASGPDGGLWLVDVAPCV